jgi:uncharacterized protein (TIGR00661 family)
MRYLFIIQGEGRGHMTQAIALSAMLREAGHEVVHAMVGKSSRREVPGFFFEKIQAPVTLFESPNFAMDSKNVKIQIGRTIIVNTFKVATFIKSMMTIRKIIKETKPDVIINFYELLCGLYSGFLRPKQKIICIGHQFLLLHPDFTFPKGFKTDRKLMRLNTAVTSMGSSTHLALSFRRMPDAPKKHVYVVPPLLRPEVKNLQTGNKGYILGYMLNSGLANEIETWHKAHPQYELHFFWDKKDAPEELKVDDKLTFHRLNDKKFLEMMSQCAAYSSTAGFESICEAMYLGKPIMMVPTYGHFEQNCNALDAKLAGGGVPNVVFDLSVLVDYMPQHKDISTNFRQWADSAKKRFLELLTKE